MSVWPAMTIEDEPDMTTLLGSVPWKLDSLSGTVVEEAIGVKVEESALPQAVLLP